MKRRVGIPFLGFLALTALSACTNPYDPGQRAAGGALLGAGAGAVLGAAAGGGHGAALGALIGGGAGALAGVATTPPPPPRYEAVPPPPPAEPMSWVPGHWRWDGYRYIWAHGHYVARPYVRAAWIPGHWVQGPRGWVWVEGHWG